MRDYNEIIQILKPSHDIKASRSLHDKVKVALDQRKRKRVRQAWVYGGIGLSSVVAILILILLPSGVSAKQFLSEAINAMGNSGSMEMEVWIRTRPVENFRYIDPEDEFIGHKIELIRTDSVLKWSIDKGGRVAVGNGGEIYTWLPDMALGWHISNTDKENILGYLACLLNPRKILEEEYKNFVNNKEVDYKVIRSDNDIILTVQTPAQGNFENPYTLNTSITESENIRKYVIDADSKRLKRASVSIISGKSIIEVLKVDTIIYGIDNKDFLIPDKHVKFIEIEYQTGGMKGLSAEEVATIILNSFENWNEKIIHQVILPEISDKLLKEKFKGSKLISVGRAFNSGIASSVFIPYTLQLSDGSLQRHNLALQKTGSGGWIVAGGL